MTDARRCKRNNWIIGDRLESTVDNGFSRSTSRIEITAIGRECVLAVETWRNGRDILNPVEMLWCLGDRKWRRVG
jgi:hypothetical protein